jgi:hypothetical protein
MSEEPRRILYLLVDGLPEAQRPALVPGDNVEVFTLTEASAPQAIEKIFAADAIFVWGEVTQL